MRTHLLRHCVSASATNISTLMSHRVLPRHSYCAVLVVQCLLCSACFVLSIVHCLFWQRQLLCVARGLSMARLPWPGSTPYIIVTGRPLDHPCAPVPCLRCVLAGRAGVPYRTVLLTYLRTLPVPVLLGV
jgi:hypothetical protein